MPRVWNLGNTTVRNPNRLRDGLIVFEKEFQGKAHGNEAEANFTKRLKESDVLDTDGSEPDWFGRKWRSAFVKLGFIVDRFPKGIKKSLQDKSFGFKFEDYFVTPAGHALIQASSQEEINDIFLRQLAFLELQSPLEKKFPSGNMKPFIFLLQVLNGLREKNEDGLSKFEIGVFLQGFRNHTEAEVKKTIKEILEYRKQRHAISGAIKRKAFDIKTQITKAIQGGVKPGTLKDYADTTVRYSKMSGLLSNKGGRITFLASKQPIIEALISKPVVFYAEDTFKYLRMFYSGAPLPIDNPLVARKEITNLSMLVKKKGKLPDLSQETDIKKLNKIRHELNQAFLLEKEQEFADRQIEPETLEEIRFLLDSIGMGRRAKLEDVYDPAAFFEWTIWRAFLALDHIENPIEKTRLFPIDEDLRPRHHAPSRGPDMVFEFDKFILVVEVTLLTTSRQEACEGEPVRRHVANIQVGSKKKVYGIFIAPIVDDNTSETFRVGSFYHTGNSLRVDIVPMTTAQFKSIIDLLPPRKILPEKLEELIKRCLSDRDGLNALSWKERILEEVSSWVNKHR